MKTDLYYRLIAALLLVLLGFAPRTAIAQDAEITLSKSVDFSTTDQAFDVGDVVYVRVSVSELDAVGLERNSLRLKSADANITREISLRNHLDGTYTTSIDALGAGEWYLFAALADDRGVAFEVETGFTVGTASFTAEARVQGAITEIGALSIVVREQRFFVSATTLITDDGETIAFADLEVGDDVTITFRISPISGELLAYRITRNAGGDVFLRGVVEAKQDNSFTLLGHTVLVSSVTLIFDGNGLPIRFEALSEGDVVEVKGLEIANDPASNFAEHAVLALVIRRDESRRDEIVITGRIGEIGDSAIFIAGVRIAVTAETKFVGPDGSPLEFADLRVGMRVRVFALNSPPDGLIAQHIRVGDDGPYVVHGRIEELGEASLVVEGIPFIVTSDIEVVTTNGVYLRFGDLEVGFAVTVFAAQTTTSSSPDRALVAKRIVLHHPSIEIRTLTGFITQIGDATIRVNRIPIRVVDRTEILDEEGEPIRFAELTVGMRVRVHTVYVLSNRLDLRVLVAKRIQVLPKRERRVVGRIRAVSETHINIAGVEAEIVDRTEIFDEDGERIPVDSLMIGDLAKMHVVKTLNGLVATDIRLLNRLDDEIGVAGVLEAIGDSSLVVLGQTFEVLSHTVVRDSEGAVIPYTELEVGASVALRGEVLPGGTLIARHVQQLNGDVRDVRVMGPVESVGASTLEVIGIHFFVDGETKIYDLDRNEVALADLEIGQTVIVDAEGQPDGTRLAKTIQLLDVTVTTGDVTLAADRSSVTIHGVEYALAAELLIVMDGHVTTDVGLLEDDMFVEASAQRVDEDQYTVSMMKVISASTVGSDDPDVADSASEIRLYQNYPNPFSGSTTITFDLPEGALGNRTTVSVFDLTGRRVRTLVDANLDGGTQETVWDGRDAAGRPVASGLYFFRIRSGTESATHTMTLVR